MQTGMERRFRTHGWSSSEPVPSQSSSEPVPSQEGTPQKVLHGYLAHKKPRPL